MRDSPSSKPHKIYRLTVEIQCHDQHLAQSLQDQFSLLCRKQLKAALDKTFSALSADDEVLRIDSLTVDLGRFTRYLDEDRLLRELPDQLSRAVELAIQQGQAQLYRSPKQASAPVNQANSLKPQTTDVAFGDDEPSETD